LSDDDAAVFHFVFWLWRRDSGKKAKTPPPVWAVGWVRSNLRQHPTAARLSSSALVSSSRMFTVKFTGQKLVACSPSVNFNLA
jgi:hypothetical protein